jgi:hypothetical protein
VRLGFRLETILFALTRSNTLSLLVVALVVGHLTTTQVVAALVGIVVLCLAKVLEGALPLNLH